MVAAVVVPIGSELGVIPTVELAPGVALSDLIVVRMLDDEIRELRGRLCEVEGKRRRYPVKLFRIV